jgi:hypothetical protein
LPKHTEGNVQNEVRETGYFTVKTLHTQKCPTYTILPENSLGSRGSIGEMRGRRSALVFFRQGLDLPNFPGAMTSLPFEGLDLSQKLGREYCFTLETLIAGSAPRRWCMLGAREACKVSEKR